MIYLKEYYEFDDEDWSDVSINDIINWSLNSRNTVIKYLEQGQDVNLSDNNTTFLITIIQHMSYIIGGDGVDYTWLDKVENINFIHPAFGWNVIGFAIDQDYAVNIIDILLSYGADLKFVDMYGKDFFELIKERRSSIYDEVLDMIQTKHKDIYDDYILWKNTKKYKI